MISDSEVSEFQNVVKAYYRAHGRFDLPWRQPERSGQFDAYKILVSEYMLQQTQVERVISKFNEFIRQFPTVGSLADVPLGTVLRAWSGLGYNRRAKFLHQSAQQIVKQDDSKIPKSTEELIGFPGIGPNTAGAIMAYAFNQPAIFIETNIRTVYEQHFIRHQEAVSDETILELVAATLPPTSSRIWYWSLMDYGSYLKTKKNPNKLPNRLARQSKFQGSRRQIRGQVIRLLMSRSYSKTELTSVISDERLMSILNELSSEGLIQESGSQLSL